MTTQLPRLKVGQVLDGLDIGPIAHGGHWVARWNGQVVFVRHGLTGEVVRAQVTAVNRRFARADVIEVLQPSVNRVTPSCSIAGRCGGCDFQHVALAVQRELKAQVIAEQLSHQAGLDMPIHVEAVEPSTGQWRTRVRYHATDDDSQRWGMRRHRSSDVVPLPDRGCDIAVAALAHPPHMDVSSAEIAGVAAASGVSWSAPHSIPAVRERAAGREWSVPGGGFWQIHPQAATVLVNAVLDGLNPTPGETGWDLYCGVGLFSGALVDRGVHVQGVEGNRRAVQQARLNVPEADFRAGDVAEMMSQLATNVDLTVLDPPRSGAGRDVMNHVLNRTRRAIAYVACDPAALARDLGQARQAGWQVRSVRAFDLFPHTHHVECVAMMER